MPFERKISLGHKAKLYYAVGGQMGSFNELTNVSDVTVNTTKELADATTRANQGWKAQVPTLRDLSIDFSMVWDENDAGFQAIRDAFLANAGDEEALLGIKALVSETGGGIKGDFAVSSFVRREALADVVRVDVTVTLTYSDHPPQVIEGTP